METENGAGIGGRPRPPALPNQALERRACPREGGLVHAKRLYIVIIYILFVKWRAWDVITDYPALAYIFQSTENLGVIPWQPRHQ